MTVKPIHQVLRELIPTIADYRYMKGGWTAAGDKRARKAETAMHKALTEALKGTLNYLIGFPLYTECLVIYQKAQHPRVDQYIRNIVAEFNKLESVDQESLAALGEYEKQRLALSKLKQAMAVFLKESKDAAQDLDALPGIHKTLESLHALETAIPAYERTLVDRTKLLERELK
ncbi:hypothetical protein LC612_37855 [Nostoc sp. CHAB 5834]|nr:hypothetical protein [Nostoc sp. CHAB 5834]